MQIGREGSKSTAAYWPCVAEAGQDGLLVTGRATNQRAPLAQASQLRNGTQGEWTVKELDETWCNGGIGGCSKRKKGIFLRLATRHKIEGNPGSSSFRHFPSFHQLALLTCFVSFSLVVSIV